MKLPKFSGKPKKRKLLAIRRVSGDSMLPTLRPGKIVVGVRARNIVPGDIVIVQHRGLEKIKRVTDIAAGKIYVQGDNRKESTDSRVFGWLSVDQVVAKVVY